MIGIWQTFLFNPILNLLVFLYQYTEGLGISIIIFTIIAKIVLIPVTIPQLKMSKKQRDLQPELEKIKKKYSADKKKQAEMQMQLFKKHGVNPGAGCLTTIVTIILMIAVYRAVYTLTVGADIADINSRIYSEALRFSPEETINTSFLYLDLAKPDPYLLLTLIAVVMQFLVAKMMTPYTKVSEKAVKKTPEKTDDLMQSMQKQNMYIMPVMFFIFGLTLPSGVMLYIAVSTLAQIIQNLYYSGWGGLKPWVEKAKILLNRPSTS